MNYFVETLDRDTWFLKEYNESASAYMYLLKGTKRALLIDSGFGTIPLRAICEKLTDLPITLALTHGHADPILAELVTLMKYGLPGKMKNYTMSIVRLRCAGCLPQMSCCL